MVDDDFDGFSGLLDAVCGLLSRGNYTPNAAHTALFFNALRRYPLDQVRSALSAHVGDPQRGRFVPTPADVIAQIAATDEADGRPGAEEAWAIALASDDEAKTVVWTAEIAEAFGIARAVLARGDEVGARMAFKEAYSRIVAESRSIGLAPRWSASIGHDSAQRAGVLSIAQQLGRLKAGDVPALPAPVDAGLTQIPDEVRSHLLELKRRMTEAANGPTAGDRDRERTAELKAQASRLVESYNNKGSNGKQHP